MNPKIIYPVPERQKMFYRNIRNLFRIIFLISGAICVLVNILVGGKAWSLIVVWSLFSFWRLVFSLRLVEFSIYSHAIKVTFYLFVMMVLIDRFLAPGWAETVVPIVMFAYLLVMFVLFFVTYDKKEKHLVSIMMLGAFNLATIPYSIHSWPIENWIAFAFQCASFLLFLVMIIVNWKDIIYELKVRFVAKTR